MGIRQIAQTRQHPATVVEMAYLAVSTILLGIVSLKRVGSGSASPVSVWMGRTPRDTRKGDGRRIFRGTMGRCSEPAFA